MDSAPPARHSPDWRRLQGSAVTTSARRIADLAGLFADEVAHAALPAETLVYQVDVYLPVAEGTPGGLFWGTTVIEPGRVGDDYCMTRGHSHATRDRAEFYVCSAGEGAMILMDEDGRSRWEPMRPGTVHYIPGHTAHRVANTGSVPLAFLACWPS